MAHLRHSFIRLFLPSFWIETAPLQPGGYRNAYGMDLDPDADKRILREGVFMNLDAPNNLIDRPYVNCVDHGFDHDQLLTEHQMSFGGTWLRVMFQGNR